MSPDTAAGHLSAAATTMSCGVSNPLFLLFPFSVHDIPCPVALVIGSVDVLVLKLAMCYDFVPFSRNILKVKDIKAPLVTHFGKRQHNIRHGRNFGFIFSRVSKLAKRSRVWKALSLVCK